MTLEPASTVLSKYKVLDLTRARAGPTAVKQLADWGASVIKIEMPDTGGPSDFAARHSPDFQNLHRNKRSLTLNLKDPKGVEIFKKLAADADVIIENYRPDVKNRLGIDYETIKAINPKIVYGSISGFGQDGPYPIGTILAKPRDAAIDDLRVDCLGGFVIDTKPVFYVGPIVLDDDVCCLLYTSPSPRD